MPRAAGFEAEASFLFSKGSHMRSVVARGGINYKDMMIRLLSFFSISHARDT